MVNRGVVIGGLEGDDGGGGMEKVEKFFGHCKIFWLAVIRRAIGGNGITLRVRVCAPPNSNHDLRFISSYEEAGIKHNCKFTKLY
jgi:hypothetical protein